MSGSRFMIECFCFFFGFFFLQDFNFILSFAETGNRWRKFLSTPVQTTICQKGEQKLISATM